MRFQQFVTQGKRLIGSLEPFAREAGGAVALIFALTLFLLFALIGGAVDFARVYRAQGLVQSALDAATLAAARMKQLGGSDADALATGNAYVAAVKASVGLRGPITLEIDAGGSGVKGVSQAMLPTTFLSVAGFEALSVGASSTAVFGVGTAGKTNVELVMMLDTTGSMKGQKLADLKVAAEELVEIVVSQQQSGATSRVGIVPFSNAVKLDTGVFAAATGKVIDSPRSYSGCVVERTGSNAYTDANPGIGGRVVPIEDSAGAPACSQGQTVQGLTDNKGQLTSLIKRLSDGGTTAGHLGTAWAWYLLSPNWADVLDSGNRPAPYSDLKETLPGGAPKLRKLAVLMTDGEYNTTYSPATSPEQAQAFCEGMKAAGIEVYTVGFGLGGNNEAIATLSGCATDTGKFYNTTTGEELVLAFRDIALRAAPLRLER